MQRRLIWVTLFSVAIVVTALYHTRKVHATQVHDNHGGCSVASLKGTYAFRRTGVNNLAGGSSCESFRECGPIARMGVAFYGGDGIRGRIRITSSVSGAIADWVDQPGPNGTYTVDSDCTGSFFQADGTHSNNVVVLDGGKRFFLLSTDTGTTVMEEGIRLEEEKH